MLIGVFNVENVIVDDIVDDDSSKDSNDDEHARLWQNFCKKCHVMEYDLEEDCGDDHHGEHDRAGELGPLPGSKMNSSMMFPFMMVSSMTFVSMKT